MSRPRSTRERVLVTDGDQRAALAVVRSLGRSGYQPYVAASRQSSLAGASRYVADRVVVPDSLASPQAHAEAVAEACRTWQIEVVIPITDAALLALLPRRQVLAPATIPFPGAEAHRAISDKARVLAAAADLGIRGPAQVVLGAPEQLERVPSDDLGFPIVVKPSRSVGEAGGERAKFGVQYARDHSDLRDTIRALPPAAFPVLLQRKIQGPGVGVFLLLWNGSLVAAFSHRRLREKPPSGGVSVYSESIPLAPELLEPSVALLERFGWSGVAMIEYKRDCATGEHYLMEVNGRFWGSLQLAMDAGVDFPSLLVGAALGKAPTPVTTYRVGIRNRWWWGDVDHLVISLRDAWRVAGRSTWGTTWRAVREFLTVWRLGDHSEILKLYDPRPAVRETLDWFARR